MLIWVSFSTLSLKLEFGAGRLAFSFEKMSSCLIVTIKKIISWNTTSIIGVISALGSSCFFRAMSRPPSCYFFLRADMLPFASLMATNESFQTPFAEQMPMTRATSRCFVRQSARIMHGNSVP